MVIKELIKLQEMQKNITIFGLGTLKLPGILTLILQSFQNLDFLKAQIDLFSKKTCLHLLYLNCLLYTSPSPRD